MPFEYSLFRKLLSRGENAELDFKLVCLAFDGGGIATKAELARDICAMANNGHGPSQLLIGVADDARSFSSVSATKLTDDNLQDFVKKAIFPPPVVELRRARWIRAESAHKGKTFIIISIRGGRGQVFRLSRDFIDHSAKVCIRRNEVWIRRGATTDLATPEEIVRILTGSSPNAASRPREASVERQNFAKRSLLSQRRTIDVTAPAVLRSIGYRLLPTSNKPNTDLGEWGRLNGQSLWKRLDSTVVSILVLPCVQVLRSTFLQGFQFHRVFHSDLASWEDLPRPITSLTRRRVKRVRRLLILPVLANVPDSRVRKALPELHWLGIFRWYFRPYLRSVNPRYNRPDLIELPSSSELLLVTPIHSVEEFAQSLVSAMSVAEDIAQAPIISAEKGGALRPLRRGA